MPQIAIAPAPAVARPLFVAGTDIVPAMSEFGQMQGGLFSGVFLRDPGQCEAGGGSARINLYQNCCRASALSELSTRRIVKGKSL